MHILFADTISALGLIKQVTEQSPSANVSKYFYKVSKFIHNLIVNVASLSFCKEHSKDNFSVKYEIK